MTLPRAEPAVALRGRFVLLGVSGGIAAYKAAALARALVTAGATVQSVLTPGATAFVGTATFAGLTGRPAHSDVFADAHEIRHVALARAADVALFAPATANLLAKFAGGFADDLVTSVFTCLTCPVVIAPAMHTEMWQHPATQHNVALLAARGARIVGPDDGALAGGDTGPG
ncbi:MAG: phosphopantothenoylcysteine decarboxylase, partial [Actinomycetota bacterium]|nr:phosphopantothenoylcysteine decarboxylase [Actinomycetota bacterium]